MNIDEALVCPKCNKKFMVPAIPMKVGMEYFCHKCHEYFGTNELVHEWGYDVADLTPYQEISWMNSVLSIPDVDYFGDISEQHNDLISLFEKSDEPEWKSIEERDNDYYEVFRWMNRHELGLIEHDDIYDPRLDLPYPIGAVGTS